MSPIRPVFLTRRFWPRMDGAARTVADLAAELVARGAEATVLTVLEHPGWPASIRCRGVSVRRFAKPEGRLGELRYARRLARWLRENADQYNLIYASGLKHDAYAAMSAVGGRVPVVLRAEKAGRCGDCLWQLDARCGRRIKQRCLKAAALVGPSRQTHAELLAAGYPRPRIHYLPHGVCPRPKRNHRTKRLARAALAESRAALDLPNWAPLAIYTGRLHRAKGLAHLVAAWRPIANRWPNAQLWLAGDGPDRAALAEQIGATHLSGRVALVGTFDHVDVLLDAADLFVLPSPDEDMSVSILEAMAAGLPVVACDVPGNRDLVNGGREGLLTPPSDAAALSAAIARLLDEPELAADMGAAAQDRASRHFPLAKSVDAHITLFEELLAGKDRGVYGRERGTEEEEDADGNDE